MSAFASSSGHTSARAFSSFVPIPDLSKCSKSLLDHFVGAVTSEGDTLRSGVSCPDAALRVA
jgi:hypothetical protein